MTRATAAKRKPVISLTTWRIAGTALILPMVAMSTAFCPMANGSGPDAAGVVPWLMVGILASLAA